MMPRVSGALSLAATVAFVSGLVLAQAGPKQVVKPPIAKGWIDVATFSGVAMGMGGTDMMNQTLGAAMGGGRGAKAEFGNTVHGPGGRWMDVTLYTSLNTKLTEALQSVPQGTGLAPTLKLQTPEKPKPAPKSDDEPAEWNYEKPRGKLVMYWGCSKTVRPGQPKVVDLSTATVGEMAKFFESRRATQLGAHAAAGRPIWPSREDKRSLGERASIVGKHAFVAKGVPESFAFQIPVAQDIMAPMKVQQTDADGSVAFEWPAVPHARAYFLGTMAALPGGKEGMVIWTSSELPDSGFGLFDYQTNAAVDRWLKDKVLLPPSTTRCAVPKEAAGEGGMLRAIAYGTELNLAYPPRPEDPKIPWEPEWSVKIRVKSMSTTIVGMEGMDDMPSIDEEPPDTGEPPSESDPGKQKRKRFNPFDAAKQSRP
ncbi:MAG: hypothetical protein WCF10_11650 [Polyangiales bacterium]